MEKLYYSYEMFKNDTLALIDSFDTQFDTVIGIARGGLTLAQAISEALEIRNVQTVQTQLYDKQVKRDCITVVANCSLQQSQNILIVDDIADSGETLQNIMEYFQKEYPTINFKSATLFYKKSSVYEPNYWIKEATGWIDFFWEVDFLRS